MTDIFIIGSFKCQEGIWRKLCWELLKSLYNFLCRDPVFKVKILKDWNKKLDNSSLKSNACKRLILSELLEKDQVHLKKEYWNLYKRYLMEEIEKL